jgi:hypothetical protein
MAAALPTTLNFITGNKNKLAEVQAILEGVIELRNQNIDLVEIQGTVEEVTTDKARRAAEAVCLIVSICFDFEGSTNNLIADQWPCPCRRHMSLLQGDERSSWTIYVRDLRPIP